MNIKNKHVFIIGSKGIPSNYGGFETFVDRLTEKRVNKDIHYHVACMAKDNEKFVYNDSECFNINVPSIGPAKAVYYDIKAAKACIREIREMDKEQQPILYVLACRIGPFFKRITRKWRSMGGIVYVNPDGNEWKRAKWNWLIRKYWKWSEKLMVKYADMLICDSRNIERYINDEYAKYKPVTKYIAYGTNTYINVSNDAKQKYQEWLKEKNLFPEDYYLMVGRFVPENNFETVIKEFMLSHSEKKLAIITTANDKLMAELKEKLHFENDARICFVGSVYDKELLSLIRYNAYGYIHGHEVGGTNPSLLEALGSTELNLLLGVGFNEEVAGETAVYWGKQEGNLARLLNECDMMTNEERKEYGEKAKSRMATNFSWEFIVDEYEKVFLDEKDIKYEKNN